jgi:RHS repeat-associated protein
LVVSPAGTTQYQYDNRDRLIQYTQADGQVIMYTYDANGNVLTRTTPAGATSFSYDSLNRCVSVSDQVHGTATFTYDALGRILIRTLPNGVATNYSYDQLGRMTHVGHSVGSAVPLQSFDYLFDAVGNRLQATEADGTQTQWAYDAVNQVIQETVVNPGGAVSRASTFAYDPAGNILTRTDNSVATSYQYNNLDQLLSAGSKTYTYDLRGNLASMTSTSGVATFSFDSANRMASVLMPAGAGSASFTYDGENRRIAQTVSGSKSQFLWDPSSGVGDVVMEANGPGNILASYAFGPSGALWRTAGSTTSFYLQDALGSVIGLTDPTAKLTDQYRYDAYGQPTLTNGSTTNPYRYRGQWTDSVTGFQYLRSRYYDPSVGRFLSRDQAGFELGSPVDFNRYRYAASNPVNASDPLGQESALEWIMLKLNIQDKAALGEYAGQRAAESVAAAALDEFADVAAATLIDAIENSVLPKIARDWLGGFKADKVTISSARAITRQWDTVIFPGMIATGNAEVIGNIPAEYDAMPRKNIVAASGLLPVSTNQGVNIALAILEILKELFGDSDVDTSGGSVGANTCTNHAERKVVRTADGKWTILGIGASRGICTSCEQAIRSNSPAAIMAPMSLKVCTPK